MTPKERADKRAQAMRLHQDAIILENQVRMDEWREEEDKAKSIRENFRLSDDHVKLLKRMEFKFYPPKQGGDLVSIGVDGKRPFGNSDTYGDIGEILGWKLPNDDLSFEQEDRAAELMKELPIALNVILKNL